MSKWWGKVEMREWTACGETTILSHVCYLLGIDLWLIPHRTWQSGIPGAGSACLSVHRICFQGCILLSSWAYSASVSQVSVFPLSVLKSSDHHHSHPLWLSKSCWNLKVSSRQSPQSVLLGCWPRRWGLTLVVDAVSLLNIHYHPPPLALTLSPAWLGVNPEGNRLLLVTVLVIYNKASQCLACSQLQGWVWGGSVTENVRNSVQRL